MFNIYKTDDEAAFVAGLQIYLLQACQYFMTQERQ